MAPPGRGNGSGGAVPDTTSLWRQAWVEYLSQQMRTDGRKRRGDAPGASVANLQPISTPTAWPTLTPSPSPTALPPSATPTPYRVTPTPGPTPTPDDWLEGALEAVSAAGDAIQDHYSLVPPAPGEPPPALPPDADFLAGAKANPFLAPYAHLIELGLTALATGLDLWTRFRNSRIGKILFPPPDPIYPLPYPVPHEWSDR